MTISTLTGKTGALLRPDDGDSFLVKKTFSLVHEKAIEQFEPEDFRILLAQRLYVSLLLPSAIALLKSNPMAEGDYFEGDLLLVVLNLEQTIWMENPELIEEMKAVILNAENYLEDENNWNSVTDELLEKIQGWKLNYK